MLGAQNNTYLFGIQFDKWEDVDSWSTIPDMLVKAFGEKEGTQILRSGTSAVEESHTRVFRYLANSSVGPPAYIAAGSLVCFFIAVTPFTSEETGSFYPATFKNSEPYFAPINA
ncbi:MAG: hypothetical protein HC767_02840, partial [Akkermansiaceae bacterium]|nr:hypothetical protein [Akkermansiaceae bacterium]